MPSRIVNLVPNCFTFGTCEGRIERIERETGQKSAVATVNRDYFTKISVDFGIGRVCVGFLLLNFYIDFTNGFTFNVWNWMFLFSGVSIQLSTLFSNTIGHIGQRKTEWYEHCTSQLFFACSTFISMGIRFIYDIKFDGFRFDWWWLFWPCIRHSVFFFFLNWDSRAESQEPAVEARHI